MLKNNVNNCSILLICFFCVITKGWANERYEIVTHPNVSAKSLSVNSLRAIFGMHLKTWPDGTIIKVFVLPDDNVLHQRFAKEKLHVFPYQLRLTWDRLVFSGTGQAPNNVSSNAEMLTKIAGTPGSIGYLKTNLINDDVHVLEIE
ncbi:MAG: hypothetical protein WAT12_12165 [Candidatus Nitrotoga sp.]